MADYLITRDIYPDRDHPVELRDTTRIVVGSDGLWKEAADETVGYYAQLLRVLGPDDTILDVVAWHEDTPERWALMNGTGLLLGPKELQRVSWTTETLRVTSTPQEWLLEETHDRQSICILNWREFNAAQYLHLVWGRIECTTDKVATFLIKSIRENKGEPLDIIGPIIGR